MIVLNAETGGCRSRQSDAVEIRVFDGGVSYQFVVFDEIEYKSVRLAGNIYPQLLFMEIFVAVDGAIVVVEPVLEPQLEFITQSTVFSEFDRYFAQIRSSVEDGFDAASVCDLIEYLLIGVKYGKRFDEACYSPSYTSFCFGCIGHELSA